MTIASEIQRIKTNIENAYDALGNLGATMPATENTDNLVTTIATVSTGDEVTATNNSSSLVTSGNKVWLNQTIQHETGQVGNGASIFYPMVKDDRVGYSGAVYSINDLAGASFTQLYSTGYYYSSSEGTFYQPKGKNAIFIDNNSGISSLGESAGQYTRSWDIFSGEANRNSVDNDGILHFTYGSKLYHINPNDLTSTNSSISDDRYPYMKSGNYYISAYFNSGYPSWTVICDSSGTAQTGWTVTGDTSVQYATVFVQAVTDSIYIIGYHTSQNGTCEAYTKNGYPGLNGICIATIDTMNHTVNFKTTSLTGELANWTNNANGSIFVTYNPNCNVLCLCQADSATPSYKLLKYENSSWTDLGLDLTGILPASNYFTSGITISDDMTYISFGYGAYSTNSSTPTYNSNRAQMICTLTGELQYIVVNYASISQNSLTGIAQENIAISSSGIVKTILP